MNLSLDARACQEETTIKSKEQLRKEQELETYNQQQALQNNIGIQEIHQIINQKFEEVHMMILNQSLAISNENYATLKSEQNNALQKINQEVNNLSGKIETIVGANKILADSFNLEAQRLNKRANKIVHDFKTNFEKESQQILTNLQQVGRGLKEHYNVRWLKDFGMFVMSLSAFIMSVLVLWNRLL